MFIGDSIMAGWSDSPGCGGYPARWAARDHVPAVNLAVFGETAGQHLRRWHPRGAATVAVCGHGVNDGYAGTGTDQFRLTLQEIWRRLVQEGVKRIYQATVTPRTVSADGWSTIAGQVTTAWTREQLSLVNEWIRSVPPPLAGYLEVGSVVSTSEDSGVWKAPGWTPDGVHPGPCAHEAILAALPRLESLLPED